MIAEVFKDEPGGIVKLDRVANRGCEIIGLQQSYVFCIDEECKQILEKNRIFIKVPSLVAGVAMYFSPYTPHETIAVIDREAGR